MNYRDQWINHAWRLASTPADFYSGCRKIIRCQPIVFTELDASLKMSDAGYTGSKMTMLVKNYLHEESKRVALELWEKRRGQEKYGSVGFTTYNHFVKGGSIDAKRSKRASVFGPCIQSVMLTWINKKTVAVDVGYRTTEFFKKFPADLVFLRDVLLHDFKLSGMEVTPITFHFANITLHPMYAVTVLPHFEDPIKKLELLRLRDEFFFNWTVKWTARYVCDEFMRGIEKFSQAMRVRKDALERLDKKTLKRLQKFLRDNHPGYRNNYEDPEDDAD